LIHFYKRLILSVMASPGEQEFVVRVPPRDDTKKHHVMKFNASLNQEFGNWNNVRMVRENNQKIVQSNIPTDDDPKFGAGSVFGKDIKEELRLKKLGINRKKYNPDAQPWLMRVNGKSGRKFKGIREGGVSNNTSYYVFTHGKDGAFEAFPVSEWYNFTPVMRYKTLDADEAEERYAQRGKIINKWAMMVNRKLKPGEEAGEEDPDGDEAGTKKGKKKDASLKISDMDEWNDEGDALDTSDDEKDEKDDSDSDGDKKKRSKDTKKKKKKKKTDVDEAFEDSDDGDDEGREVDYMSDESSDSEQELEKDHDVKGVDQDEGISKMLDSDSEEDEDKKKSGESDDEDDEDETGKKKKKSGSDDEGEKKGKNKKSGSAANSRSTTPTKEVEKAERDQKRKAMVANILDPNAAGESAAKKSRLEQFGSSGSSASTAFGDITEEDVRRYLKRRPMTTTDLLKKFKSKKQGLKNNNELVQHLANILKKINPHKQKSKGTVYLSLKE